MWGQNGLIQGNSYVEKMLDIIVKIAKRKGPKYFGSALTLTASVAAGLNLHLHTLVYYTAAEVPALPVQLHLSLELSFCTAGSEHHHGEYFQWAGSACLSSCSSLYRQNRRQLLELISAGPGCLICFFLALNKLVCACPISCTFHFPGSSSNSSHRAVTSAQEIIGNGLLCSSTCEYVGGNLHLFFNSITGQASVTSGRHIRGTSRRFYPGSGSVTLHKIRLWEVVYHVTAG